MNLLVAYEGDPAGRNMAESLAPAMRRDGPLFRGDCYDLLVSKEPVTGADAIADEYGHDGFVFLSRHAAKSGVLALTCHSTGNFGAAALGGNEREVAVPHPHLQKAYMGALHSDRSRFPGFDITIEATHHGPTGLARPSVFVEIGTTESQWNDRALCGSVARILDRTLRSPAPSAPVAVAIGGTHYPAKFTSEVIRGRYALGTVIPRHALGLLDGPLFSHILERNGPDAVLVDRKGLGPHRERVERLVEESGLEAVAA